MQPCNIETNTNSSVHLEDLERIDMVAYPPVSAGMAMLVEDKGGVGRECGESKAPASKIGYKEKARTISARFFDT